MALNEIFTRLDYRYLVRKPVLAKWLVGKYFSRYSKCVKFCYIPLISYEKNDFLDKSVIVPGLNVTSSFNSPWDSLYSIFGNCHSVPVVVTPKRADFLTTGNISWRTGNRQPRTN